MCDVWHVPWAAVDAAARRNSAARFFALRKTGARRASSAMRERRCETTSSCATTSRVTASEGLDEDVGRGLPAETRENGLHIWHAVQAALDAVARRNGAARIIARRKNGARRASNAVWQGAWTVHNIVRNNAPCRSGRLTRSRRGARAAGRAARRWRGIIRRTVCDVDTQRGQLWTPRRGATTRTRQDRRETREQRGVVRLTANTQRRAQQHPVTPRAKGAKKRGGGKAAGRAARRCRRRIRRLICEFGSPRGQLWTSRRGATTLAASSHAASPARDTQATRCGNGKITASCSTAHRDAAGDRREEDAAGRATRRCRRRIKRQACEFGRRRGQLWAPRRGATARAASLHAARPEQDVRATQCGKPHGAITA